MWKLGTVSSLFDLLTFWLLLQVLKADEALFHTGWFVESLATQVLVIFVIRTRGNPLRSRPATALTLTSLIVVACGALLPFAPFADKLGFVAPPVKFYLILLGTAAVYLVLAQWIKSRFYASHSSR